MKRFAFLLLLAACFAASIFAQDITGTIEGTVLDPSGAAVPKAKVTVTNTDRNQAVRTLTTDTSGTYSAVLLPIGNYSVKAEATGFKTALQSGIVLNVNDVLKINVTMQVGAVTETVEVSAAATTVELGTAASEGTIDGSQVRELSLATRNYEQLVSLMPGVSNQTAIDELFVGTTGASGTTATIPYSVNGMRNSANNYTLDGADNVDRGSNQTLGSYPSIDAIAEFKVGRSTYTADQGRAGGAQINVITKSGTSHYHGGLYEFFRNDALNANNWANNANKVTLVDKVNPQTPCTVANYTDCYAKQSPYRWNDFGGSVGGPVPLGSYNREKNKLFFFYSEEARRIINYTTYTPTLPTQGMLQGNFPQPVCITSLASTGITCPSTASPVTSIPTSQFNANSVAYIKDVFSKMTLAGGNTLGDTTSGIFPERILLNFREELVKIDERVNDKFAIFGKFSNDAIPTVEPGGLFSCSTFPGGCVTHTNSPGRNYIFHATNTIKPTLLNEAGFAFTQSAIVSIPQGLTAKTNDPDINPKEPFANTQGVVPNLSFTGGTTLAGYGPYNDYNRNYNFFDNMTWIRGRHTVRFGYTINRYNKTENAASQQGSFGFTNAGAPVVNGVTTNSFVQSWANFLLGNVSSFSMPSTDITPYIIAWQHEAFAQDDFKVSPRLTVYYGIRWSFFGQPTDRNGELSNFDPALYSRANAPAINPATGTFVTAVPVNQANLTQLALNSGLGLIVAGKNSPFGNKIAPDAYHNFAPRLGLAWDPTGDGKTAIRAGWGVYYDSGLFGTYEQNIFANPPFVQSIAYANVPFSDVTSGTPTGTISSPLNLHATQLPAQVPYSMQWNLTVEHNFAHNTLVSVAYVGSKGTHLLGIVDINEAYPGAGVAAGLLPAGTTIFTSSTEPRLNAVRPYYGWGYIDSLETAFDSNYHSLQATVRKDFRGAGTVFATYTYSKNLTDNGSDRSNAPTNSYNWHDGEYGPYPGDRKQILNLSYFYTIPIFKGSHGLTRTAFAGWQVSGILSTYTGLPLTVTTSSIDPAGQGTIASAAAGARPDMVCSDPNSQSPKTYAATTQAEGQALNWFNPGCFAAVPQGVIRPGNAGRGTIRGPGFFNLDASLMKNFYITGESSKYFQFRWETFNTFNWVNPNAVSTNNTSVTFGEITSFRAPRRMQLGLKFYF
jgi:Carboxypeptidase regulatory-like domain